MRFRIASRVLKGLWVLTICAAVPLACGGGGDAENEELAACDACASMKCPDESAACDASSACQALRSCELSCPAGDSTCQNDCVAETADDSNAILTAANYVACAARECPDTCRGSASSSSAGGGTSSGGSTTTSTTGGSSVSGNSSTTGGSTTTTTTTTPPRCQDLVAWATGCAVDTDAPFRACDSTPLQQCNASCYLGATCDDYLETKTGTGNDLTICLDSCELSYGSGGDTVDCATAAAKFLACDLGTDLECDDANPLDQCLNLCRLDYDCDVIREAFLNGIDNAFTDCYAACEANTGGDNPNFVVDEGGYVTTPRWHGYAWTATDGVSSSTISPADFSTLPAGGQLCVSGTVAGTADYSAVAMLGLNLNQETGMPAPDPSNWNASGNGIYYNITNTGGSPLRIQIQAPGGDSDPTLRWCADVVGQSGNIFWTTFNTECWEGGAGTAFGGAGSLLSVAVLVPGDTAARSFSFCVYDLRVDG